MKKYIKILTLLLTFIAILLFSNISFCFSSFDMNSIDLNKIDKSTLDTVKDAVKDININNLNSSAINNIIKSSNLNVTNINANDVKKAVDTYKNLSNSIVGEKVSNIIKDNNEILNKLGLNEDTISVAQNFIKNVDSNTITDIITNELDLNELIKMYKNGASTEEIMSHIINETSFETKISIVYKMLIANIYFKIALVMFIFVLIYSIYITGLIFKKAGKSTLFTLIPIYRDIIYLQICGLSPYFLLLLLVPILGWLALIVIYIIAKFRLSKRFGHGTSFGFGLLFLSIIFRSILAFSKDKYQIM